MLTSQAITQVLINPDFLDKLMTALHPVDFNADSTPYQMGYEQHKTDFKRLLTHHLNPPILPEIPKDSKRIKHDT